MVSTNIVNGTANDSSVAVPHPMASSQLLLPKLEEVGSNNHLTRPMDNGTAGGSTPIRTTKASENRRSNKPVMEKRRRARINNCLNELKTLILDAMKKDPARHSKLEKADILEMTVSYLKTIQRQQPNEAKMSETFCAGFTECIAEVDRYSELENGARRKLVSQLASHLSHFKMPNIKVEAVPPQDCPQVQVHILPNPQRVPEQVVQPGIILSNGTGGGVQLVPTRLPNGDIALVLPASVQSNQQLPSPVPLLVPITPERSVSDISSASSSGYSPSNSPELMDVMYSPAQQKPLSLVVRKSENNRRAQEERRCWRPW